MGRHKLHYTTTAHATQWQDALSSIIEAMVCSSDDWTTYTQRIMPLPPVHLVECLIDPPEIVLDLVYSWLENGVDQ